MSTVGYSFFPLFLYFAANFQKKRNFQNMVFKHFQKERMLIHISVLYNSAFTASCNHRSFSQWCSCQKAVLGPSVKPTYVSFPRSGPSQSGVVLPALKQSLSSTIAERQRRIRAVQRDRFKRTVRWQDQTTTASAESTSGLGLFKAILKT